MRKTIACILVLAALVLEVTGADARRRSSNDVRREQQQNQQQLQRNRQQLEENRRNADRQLNALNLLNAEIAAKTAEIDRLQTSIDSLESRIESLNDSIEISQNTINRLRRDLGRSLRERRSNRQRMTSTAMVFASSSFHQAMRKIGYLNQLDKWRKAKGERLRHELEELDRKRLQLSDSRLQLNSSLQTLEAERNLLACQSEQQQQLVARLRSQGAALRAAVEERQRKAAALDAELNRVIEEELAEERRLAEEQRRAEAERQRAEQERQRAEQERQRTPSPGNTPTQSTPPVQSTPPAQSNPPATTPPAAVGRLTGSFASNKGNLPYPVSGRYNVVGRFGVNTHSNFGNVQYTNLGIDIETTPGTNARAIFDGTVTSIFLMEGYRNIILVRHGEYITVYANIDDLSVRKGDNVRAGQNLGRIYSDSEDNNRTILHFEVRHEREKLDPMEWLR